MKVLVCSYAYWPSVGGMETTAQQWAEWLKGEGNDVVVLTATPGGVEVPGGVAVVRRPGVLAHIRLFLWADVVVSKHVATRLLWPNVLLRRPLTIWYAGARRGSGILSKAFLRLVEWGSRRVANSGYVASQIAGCVGVVSPGYDDRVFRRLEGAQRKGEFVFCGRLAPEKGVDLLIEAMAAFPQALLTVIGGGPAEAELREKACGLGDRVRFLGARAPNEVNVILNAHRVILVPSRYAEPFGKVAIEGQAAGCVAVVSDRGGLPEAAGPEAVVFAAEDVEQLVAAMREALGRPMPDGEHLRQHRQNVSFLKLAEISGLGRSQADR